MPFLQMPVGVETDVFAGVIKVAGSYCKNRILCQGNFSDLKRLYLAKCLEVLHAKCKTILLLEELDSLQFEQHITH